jgi:acyl-CoA synthetase (NDP forming)
VSSFVSAGNRADVSGNDCMPYWEEDPSTVVVGLYLESMGNARKFSRIARRLSRKKPIIVVKCGVSGTASRQGAWSAARAHRAKHSTPLDNADLSYVWRKRITSKAVEEAIREAGSQDQAR